MKPTLSLLHTALLAGALLGIGTAASTQPSGGPYGPIPQTWEIPADAAAVIHVAPDGDPAASGADIDHPTTIEAALARATTGAVIVLRGGVYRTGGLRTNQGITLQPWRDEVPVFKGTRVATNWTKQRNGLWRTHWDTLFPRKPAGWWQRDREGTRTPLWRFNDDMVFADGRMLQSVGWEGAVDENTFYIDYETGDVYIGVDPDRHRIEITAHDSALIRTIEPLHGRPSDGRGLTLRGITFTQYAYRALEIEGREPEGPEPETEYGNDVTGSLLEHLTLSFCSRVAGYLRGDGLTIRHCLVSDTSTEGIYILASSDVLLERNIFRRNNIEGITGYYPAAVKIFNQSHRVTCRDNLVTDNHLSNGIWYDVGNRDGVFINNWVEQSIDGFFFEISIGAICAGNVFIDCEKGVRSLNSARVRVYNNTFVNTMASFERTPRSAVGDHFGWHPATGPEVDERHGHEFVGNVLVVDGRHPRAPLNFEQTPELCDRLTDPQVSRLDGNLYVRLRAERDLPLIHWSPAANETCGQNLGSLEALRAIDPAFEPHGVALTDFPGQVFRSIELRNLQLLPAIAEKAPRVDLPPEVARLLHRDAAAALAGANAGN